jgi:signal transduction histidine kinase
MPPETDRKRLFALRRTLDVLAGDSERLERLILELLSREDRRAGYRIEADPDWGDLAAAIRQARRRRVQTS